MITGPGRRVLLRLFKSRRIGNVLSGGIDGCVVELIIRSTNCTKSTERQHSHAVEYWLASLACSIISWQLKNYSRLTMRSNISVSTSATRLESLSTLLMTTTGLMPRASACPENRVMMRYTCFRANMQGQDTLLPSNVWSNQDKIHLFSRKRLHKKTEGASLFTRPTITRS